MCTIFLVSFDASFLLETYLIERRRTILRRYCCPHLCDESLNCDVSNEADILVSHIGQAIYHAENEMNDELIKISNMLFTFMAALRSNREFTIENVDYVANLESKYKSMLNEKLIFVIPTGNELSSLLHVCRSYAKKVSRLFFKFESSTDFSNDEMSDFINTLSTLFYNMAKYVNQEENIKEIQIER